MTSATIQEYIICRALNFDLVWSERSVVGRHEYSDTYDGKQKGFCQAPTTRWDRYYVEWLVYQIFFIQLPLIENHRSWNSVSEDL